MQHELQDMMQDLVGIVRREDEMEQALDGIGKFKSARRERRASTGNREYNPGWHTALDLKNLLTVSEAITRSALDRKESRGGHFRDDFPEQGRRSRRSSTSSSRKARGRLDAAAPRADSRRCPPNLKQVIEEMKVSATRDVSHLARRRRAAAKFVDYKTEIDEGMVVLDAVHQIQADAGQRPRRAAGTARPASAARARPRSTACRKLMCMTRLRHCRLDKPVTVEPMRTFPRIRDLVTDVSWNFRVKKKIKTFKPRTPDAPDGTWRMQQEDIDRVQEFRKCIECFLCQDVCHVLRDHHKHDEFIGPRFLVYTAALEMHPLDTEDRLAGAEAGARHRLLQHHQVLHQGLPRRHQHHRQRDHPAEGARGGRVLRSNQKTVPHVPQKRLVASPDINAVVVAGTYYFYRRPNMAGSKRKAAVRIRKAEPLDLEFLLALEKTLSEWNSDTDERAYRDL